MPSPATFDFRLPTNFTFDSAANGSKNSPEYPTFSTGSSSFTASTQPDPATSATRSKPRLVKQRRSSKSSSSDSGNIKPFRSVLSSQSVPFTQFENAGFVFGVSNSNKVDVNSEPGKLNVVDFSFGGIGNVDSGKTDSLHTGKVNLSLNKTPQENHSGEGEAFSFRAVSKDRNDDKNVPAGKLGSEFELSDEMKKLNIENLNKGSGSHVQTDKDLNNTDIFKDGNPVFVFESGLKSSNLPTGNSRPLKTEVNIKNYDESNESLNAGKTGGRGAPSADDNIFVFGSCQNSTIPGGSSFKPQFRASSVEIDKVRVEVNENPSSFFSNLGAEAVSGEPKACSTSKEKKVEFGFKLPDLNASLSFSANLVNGLGSKQKPGLRTRVPKDKHLRKTKGKSSQSKPSKQHPVEKPRFTESITHDEETSECYSPMDFSPYEKSSSNSDASLTGHHAADQPNLRNGCLFDANTDSQPNLEAVNSCLVAASTVSSASISSNLSGHDGDGGQSCVGSNGTSGVELKFAFTASGATQEHVLSTKHQHRKKYRSKTGYKSGTTSVLRGSTLGSKPLLNGLQGQHGHFIASKRTGMHRNEVDGDQDNESGLSATEKACDKWRKRGNEAYEKGELVKAHEFYTWGVNSVPSDETFDAVFSPLVRCYSNRAATRMALGMVREAIQDCLMAVKLDPSFHRAQIRAANCHLLLGELDDAVHCFEKSMDSSNVLCLDRQVVISASDGIQKSQKVIECISRCAELLKVRTCESATSALEIIAEGMSISPHSEKFIEMKAKALCMLGKHEEAITLCQETLDFAEKNFTAKTPGSLERNVAFPDVRLWRHHISSKCHFHLGRLEMALDLLEKHESESKTEDSPESLAVTIRELLKRKSAGNSAFQCGSHLDAVEHYTCAISSSMESRPFAAICFCNRAAAHQALGQFADAISDCSLAISLDENYAKAISRRATLYEMIRDYKQAACDLQRLVCLQKQSKENLKQSGSGNGKELKQVQQRLSRMEEEAKKDVHLDFYQILGVKKADPATEIKKAYRKAALKHHPDKAAQALVRSDVGDEGRSWKDISELVHQDSDRLFKMIGEAYAVLSDPTKREEYDLDEDMRKVLKESKNARNSSRRNSDYYSYNFKSYNSEGQGRPFERSSNGRYWQDTYTTYNSYRRW